MTLLLGSRSADKILLSADGYSSSSFNSKGYVGRTTLQKLFHCGRFAVGHYGDNWLTRTGSNNSAKHFITSWKQSELPDLIEEALDSFCQYVRALRSRHSEFGFWFAGFDSNRAPRCYRITSPSCMPIEIQDDYFCDGDGARYLPLAWQKHDQAFKFALCQQLQDDKRTFGDCTHQLKISFQGCTWSKPWKNRGLRIAKLLPKTSPLQLNFTDPRQVIIDDMNRLKKALWIRSGLGGTSRPRLDKIETALKNDLSVNWKLIYQLVAIGDEAEHATSNEVFSEDAALFRSQVDTILNFLRP